MKKRFIEWDLPLAEISKESEREKSIRHDHPSTLHIWWARRPLASSRATNFAALIDLPDDNEKRKEITELIKKITPWEAVKNGDDANIKKAQQMIKEQWGDQPPRVLDPFAGGGSIPLEALKLGCETYAGDYNPVAVLIEKATLEWPQKFGIIIPHPDKNRKIDGEVEMVNFLTYMVEKWANIIHKQVKEEIGQFYLEGPDGSIPVGYIWTRTIPCQNPRCGVEIPLVRQFWLSKKSNKNVAYKPIVDNENRRIDFEIVEGDDFDDFEPTVGTIVKGDALCPICGQVTKGTKIRSLAQQGNMKQRLVAVILHQSKKIGKIYRIANENDCEIFKEAERFLENKKQKLFLEWGFVPVPDEIINSDSVKPRTMWLYGMKKWGDLFNSRQKLALITFMEKIKSSYEEIIKNCDDINSEKFGLDSIEFAKAVMGYLALGLDRLVDFGSSLCILNPTGGRGVVHTFGRQAFPMVWDYSESNPFNPFGAGWQTSYEKNKECIEHGSKSGDYPAIVNQSSATSLHYPNNYFDAVFTDPPYYDNVNYAELSDFFYVWLKRAIGDLFPEIFATPLVPKSEEIVQNPARHGGVQKGKQFFEYMITKAFKEIYRVLKTDGITTIVYAHKTTAGWETILNSLINAGLVVTASWPIHTERTGKFGARYKIAILASSIYMVCRKTEREKVGFYSELQPQIKERVETKLQQFWNERIAGGDFFISAIGPGMEIFSQYERVEKLSGEQVTTVELLEYIRSVSTDFIVRKLLTGASSAKIDNESEFYLAYRWTYLDNTVEYDDARKLASASGFSLEDNWGPNGFVKKSGSKITVLGPKERGDIDKVKSMVDVMHKTLLLWEKGKKEELSELLAQTGYADNPAFKQFCQAVAESLLNGNKEKQLLEGFLIGIDTYKRGEVKVPKAQTVLKEFGGY